jgi:two-component system invasion response regulator UvrY
VSIPVDKAKKLVTKIFVGSDREYQVMVMIASGKTVQQIAEELSLSVKTISTYRIRTLGKTGMKNNAEITYYAIKHALVD